ncbi:MAG: homoserine kinase [Desulfonatronovibrio sp.]
MKKRCIPVEGSCIILVGMPGSGKSTVGKAISLKSGQAWVDTDYLMESWWGMPLQSIRDRLGLEDFLAAEEELVCSLKFYNTVISTGGSVIYSPMSMEHLEKLGKIVYLKASLETIKNRVKNTAMRGLAMKNGQSIEDVYVERIPLYEKYAQKVLDTDNVQPDENALQIISWIEK